MRLTSGPPDHSAGWPPERRTAAASSRASSSRDCSVAASEIRVRGSAARWGAKSFLRGQWMARRMEASTLGQLELKFQRNATATLFASRFLPGTRVATSIAAGLFSMPPGWFATITGCAVLVWVAAIFSLTRAMSELTAGLAQWTVQPVHNAAGPIFFQAFYWWLWRWAI